MRTVSIALVAAFMSLSSYALACNDHAPGTEPAKQSVGRESPWVAGDVREVDLEQGTITLAHGRIANPHMEPMSSMLFKVSNSKLIAKAKSGDKVKFRVAMIGEQPTVTRLTIAGK